MLLHTGVTTCPPDHEEIDTDYDIAWPSVGANVTVIASCPNAAGTNDIDCMLCVHSYLNAFFTPKLGTKSM